MWMEKKGCIHPKYLPTCILNLKKKHIYSVGNSCLFANSPQCFCFALWLPFQFWSNGLHSDLKLKKSREKKIFIHIIWQYINWRLQVKRKPSSKYNWLEEIALWFFHDTYGYWDYHRHLTMHRHTQRNYCQIQALVTWLFLTI